MAPEVWVFIAAAFVSGGAVGSMGTLLARWILSNVEARPARPAIDTAEREVLRSEVAELHKHLRNMDARLDFTERLLDGALPLAPPRWRQRLPLHSWTLAEMPGARLSTTA